MLKIIYRIIGTISLGLGILGIALPVLPTTPFLLLTAFLYLKSAPNWHKKLIESKHLGPYILNFQENKSLPLRVKIISVSMLWITISLSAIFFVSLWWVRVILFCVAVGVTYHILSYPTLHTDAKSQAGALSHNAALPSPESLQEPLQERTDNSSNTQSKAS